MKAFIVTDIQNDFLPKGALAVQKSDEIIPIVNRLMRKFDHVIATQDWHPLKHVSFASTHGKKIGEKITIHGQEQILWPDHCVQNTHGAALAKDLEKERIEKVFYKGVDLNVDSYSTFFDNEKKRSTGLFEYLVERKIKDLYFAGLTTDYCILYSVLDALELQFHVWVIQDACRAVNLSKEDEKNALKAMRAQGAKIIQSIDL